MNPTFVAAEGVARAILSGWVLGLLGRAALIALGVLA
jgi:hypothetical protein